MILVAKTHEWKVKRESSQKKHVCIMLLKVLLLLGWEKYVAKQF